MLGLSPPTHNCGSWLSLGTRSPKSMPGCAALARVCPAQSGLMIALLHPEQPNAADGSRMSKSLSIHRHIKGVIEMQGACSFQPALCIIFHCRKIFRRRKET